jgi:RNA polymerase sigma-70 factor, ECF subfamily
MATAGGPEPIVGFDAVMRLQAHPAGVLGKNPSQPVRIGSINGLPGSITLEGDGEPQTTALDIKAGKIATIYVVQNPDKLKRLHQVRRSSQWIRGARSRRCSRAW